MSIALSGSGPLLSFCPPSSVLALISSLSKASSNGQEAYGVPLGAFCATLDRHLDSPVCLLHITVSSLEVRLLSMSTQYTVGLQQRSLMNKSLLFLHRNFSSGWSLTHYIVEDDLELLVLLL